MEYYFLRHKSSFRLKMSIFASFGILCENNLRSFPKISSEINLNFASFLYICSCKNSD